MARDDQWRGDQDRDFERDARQAQRQPDYGRRSGYPDYEPRTYAGYRDPRADERYRRWAQGVYEDEHAYQPFGTTGPTAYYHDRPYDYGARGGYYDSGPAYAPRPPAPPGRDYPAHLRAGRGDEARSWLDRTGDEIASWFGDRDAERRRRGDEIRAGEHRGRGPKDYRRSDERIHDDINDRLTEDPFLDATDIVVAVTQGEVSLTGAVETREDKRRAERLAEQVSGVRDVQNSLRLKPTAGPAATAGVPTPGNF